MCKVETYFRLTGQKYETTNGDVRKAPRQQLPVASNDGKLIPDSTAIIDELERKREPKFDTHPRRERACGSASNALKGMTEARHLPLHVFPWEERAKTSGLAQDALYLVRPDGYMALARDGVLARS